MKTGNEADETRGTDKTVKLHVVKPKQRAFSDRSGVYIHRAQAWRRCNTPGGIGNSVPCSRAL